ncbi:TPA: hypothetical protein N0F65_005403 [Lagenidium giganteum]|uniref:Transmembrane protein 267 n=1 Tax=Lagenidium giganteum TaxID=4803 RepID=A0AAV2Z222_9STRA|nr:TPA: hypothetical protein N0F65_005403 [Lagenidium giganteum]
MKRPSAVATCARRWARLRDFHAQALLTVTLVVVCVIADSFLAQQSYLADAALFRHLVDSATHGCVAFCAWGIYLFEVRRRLRSFSRSNAFVLCSTASSSERNVFLECAMAAVTACSLDIDHFIAAASFTVSGASHLNSRPFGHAVTFVVALLAVIWYCRATDATQRIMRVTFVGVALMSHQLRDAHRRGLWFWPLGSTPALPYAVYLALELALPVLCAKSTFKLLKTHPNIRRFRVQDDDDIDDDEDDFLIETV